LMKLSVLLTNKLLKRIDVVRKIDRRDRHDGRLTNSRTFFHALCIIKRSHTKALHAASDERCVRQVKLGKGGVS
jgi:hypothetical protein